MTTFMKLTHKNSIRMEKKVAQLRVDFDTWMLAASVVATDKDPILNCE